MFVVVRLQGSGVCIYCSGTAKNRQAYRSWVHKTYGGDWSVDIFFLFGDINEAFIAHLNREVRDRVAKIVEKRIERGVPLNKYPQGCDLWNPRWSKQFCVRFSVFVRV